MQKVGGSRPPDSTRVSKLGKGFRMSAVDYQMAMLYLDQIEAAMDDIAAAVGHPSMADFFAEKASQSQ